MATWTDITNAALEPGKPIRSVDGIALRDNPIAITEGASGAPKIQNAAMDNDTVDDRLLTGTATSVGRDWVLARTALANVGVVGTYAFLFTNNTNQAIDAGSTYAGSNLNYGGVNLDNTNDDATWTNPVSSSPAGTWRAMGEVQATADRLSETLFLRIA